ncbi:uncharacterized protein [Bemisia tabaci]|uniref:uncharacterized protein n=1 Tax=Bemisia tabaci TaxID=7038 RepID=UPI003B28D700
MTITLVFSFLAFSKNLNHPLSIKMTTLEELNTKINTLTSLVGKLADLHATQASQPSTIISRPPVQQFSFPPYSGTSSKSLEEYFQRLKLKLQLSNIPDENFASYLRIHMGSDLVSTLNNICYPTNVSSLSFDDITKELTSHLIASKNKYSVAIKFRDVVQKSDESILEYVTRLKSASRYCGFGTFLAYSLTVQFIHGIIRDDIRDEIVSIKPENFNEALSTALDM